MSKRWWNEGSALVDGKQRRVVDQPGANGSAQGMQRSGLSGGQVSKLQPSSRALRRMTEREARRQAKKR